MKFDRIDLINLINECINEVLDFNNIENYNYKISNLNITNEKISQIGYFKLDDGAVARIYIEKIDSNKLDIPPIFDRNNSQIINIVYSINSMTTQYKKTNLRIFLKILKTVSLIINEFVQKHEIENIIYILHSEPKTDFGLTDKQKGETYKMLLNKQLPSYYRVSDGIYNNKPIIVFQKDKIHEKRYYNRLKNNL